MSSNRFCSLLVFLLAFNTGAIAGTLPHTASLNGSMLFQAFSVRPPGTIDLGPSAVGVNTPHAFPVPIFVTNTGATGLNIAPSFTGDFGFTAESTFSTPVTLAPGQTKEGDILFFPSAAGVRTGQFISTDNAPGSPHMVPLTGVGVAVPNNDFGIVADANISGVPSGQTTTFKIWLLAGPNLPFGFDGNLQCSGGPSGTSCNLVGNAFSIDGSSGFGSTRQSVQVTVTIPARSASLRRKPLVFWWGLPACALVLLRRRKRKASLGLAIMSIALLSGLVVSCGGSSNSNSGALLFTASRNGTTHTLSLPVQ